MFKCTQCSSEFTHKDNLVVHQKKHDGLRFSCTICNKTFNDKSHCNRHMKNVHGVTYSIKPIRQGRYVEPTQSQSDGIALASQIITPNTPTVAISNNQTKEKMGLPNKISNDLYIDDDDDHHMTIINEHKDNIQDSYTTTSNGKRISTANSISAAKAKKARMNLVQSPGFVEISSSANRKLCELTYNRPNVENSSGNRAFKTSAKEMYMATKIEKIVEESFMILLSEEDTYTSRGSGFTLQSIDGLLVAIYKYKPMLGSSYIQLPKSITDKRAIINPKKHRPTVF